MADLPNLAKPDYVERINRAIDHVMRHLDQPLRLEAVAEAACFSPYHFHRIFQALVGETVHAFVKRVRLEHALVLISQREGRTWTDVALACGFGSSSDFSRSFSQHFGVPPRAFDVARFRNTRRQQMQAKLGLQRLEALPPGANPDGFAVRLRSLPARRVVYRRVFDPYSGGVDVAAQQLMAWARARGLAGGQWLGYQWDDPEIVALALCRYDVGLEVPAGTPADGEVNLIDFPAMRVAELDIAGPAELELRALDWLYKTWLPRSGFAPDHLPCFEAWNGEPFAHGVSHFELRLQLAVVSAAVAA